MRPRPVVRSPVSTTAPAALSRRTLSETVGLDRPVAAAISARVACRCAISARSTCSSESERSSSRVGFVGPSNSRKDSCLNASGC